MSNTAQKVANPTFAIEENRAEVNGQAIHCLKAGAGPTLVLVHGYPESSETWRRIIPELAQSFTVIAPDTRGVGLLRSQTASPSKTLPMMSTSW